MSNSATMERLTMDELGREEFGALERYFEALGRLDADGDAGTVTIHDVPVSYQYVADKKQLTMTITTPSKRVTPAKIRSLLGQIGQRFHDVGDYGIYSYVKVTIKNESDQTVMYSQESVENGELVIKENRIDPDEEALAFQARSSTGSTKGCKGEVIYSFADGNTQLTMSYQLIGDFVHTFNAGVKGTNAQRFAVTAANTEPHFECGDPWATEMNPTVTIKMAKP